MPHEATETPPSRAGAVPAIALLAALVGAAASSALLADYTRRAAVYCAEDGGCAKVRAWATMSGIPFPAIGVGAFAVLAVLALLPGKKARVAHAIVASLGATIALVLIGLQAFFIHAFCTYCLVVDVVAVALGPLAVVRAWQGSDLAAAGIAGRFRRAAPALVVLAAVGPVGFGLARPPRAPTAIRELEATAPPKALAIVVFTDFECPYCRALHPKLEAAIAPYRDQIRVFRIDKPLRMHPHARDAARAHVCVGRLAPQADVAERFAHRLFETEDSALNTVNLTRVAEEFGVPKAAFSACILDAATEQTLADDGALFTKAGGFGLPLLFVGRVRIEGDADDADLARTVRDELVVAGGDAMKRAGGDAAKRNPTTVVGTP